MNIPSVDSADYTVLSWPYLGRAQVSLLAKYMDRRAFNGPITGYSHILGPEYMVLVLPYYPIIIPDIYMVLR